METVLLVCALGTLANAMPSRALAEPQRIDGVAALVGGSAAAPGVDVILRSDVELRARLASMNEGTALPLGALSDRWLAQTLDAMIGEHVIAREARRLQVVRATAADVEQERTRLIATAGGPLRIKELLEAIGAGVDELDDIASRRALVGAFLSANLEGASVANGELERWVKQLRARTPLQIYATW